MKKIFLVLVMVFMLTGCSTKYDTIPNKDVSLKIRCLWFDLDYDSRIAIGVE